MEYLELIKSFILDYYLYGIGIVSYLLFGKLLSVTIFETRNNLFPLIAIFLLILLVIDKMTEKQK